MVIKKHIVLGVLFALYSIFLVWMTIYVSSKKSRPITQINGSDTTIVINNYYDTAIYLTTNKTLRKDTTIYYKDFDTNITTYHGMCDSVRKYSVLDGNDSIEIYGDIWTLGTLVKRDMYYRWKLPYTTEVIKTVYTDKSGLLVSADILGNGNISVGMNIGYLTKNNYYFHGGYFTDKSIIFGVGKIISFKRKKAASGNFDVYSSKKIDKLAVTDK